MALANAAPRRPGRTLYHYLLREMTLPTLFTLLILTVLFLTEDMLRFSELVMNRGLGAGAVASISLYKAVPAVTWSLPFAALMGVFIALGRLGTDRELLAIEASGVSYARLVRPVLLFSTLAAAANLALSNFAAPAANRALDATLEELAQEKPWSAIEQGHVQRFGDWKLHAREVSPGGDRLTGVQLWMPDVGETVFAESGTLDPGEAGGIEITLSHGAVFLNPRRTPRLLRFDTLTAQLPSNLASVTRTDADRLSGSTLAELLWSDQLEARVELHRRFALPAASLAFGLLALPLFLAGAGFSRSGGWVLALGCTLIYYVLVQLTNGLVVARTWSPGFGVWLPDLVFLVAGALLALRLTRMSAFGRDLTRPTHRQPAESARPLRRRFRSAPLARYVAGRFLSMAVLCFSAVLASYLIIDVLERMDRFATHGATSVEVLRYYAARIPLLASRVLPMSLLVATALAVSLFAANGELVAMRACGIPAPRGLLPILVLCAAIAPLYFLLNDQVIPRTNALADRVNEIEIKNRTGKRASVDVWYREGNSFYEADLFDPEYGVAHNITVYELGANGLPVNRADARRARHVGGGLWRLQDHVRVEASNGRLRRVDTRPFARLGDVVPENVDTRHLSIEELTREIRELEENGIDPTNFRVDRYVKVATPFACLVLPALALFFSLGGPPHPKTTATLVFSAGVAVTYTLLTGLGTSLGYGKTLPPALAGLAP
ncbi:MAG: LptF/LptG family permease, partial [Myxococcota bacterium]